MRLPLPAKTAALLGSCALAWGATACGTTTKGPHSRSTDSGRHAMPAQAALPQRAHTAPPQSPYGVASPLTHATPRRAGIVVPAGYVAEDEDDDNDHPGDAHGASDDPRFYAGYGPPARPADAHAIAKLVKRYYAAAAKGDAATMCSLLDKSMSEELAAEAKPATGHGSAGCTAGMARALANEHSRLARKDPATMLVVGARVRGSLGLAVLAFKAAPLSCILLERDGRSWKVDALFDTPVT